MAFSAPRLGTLADVASGSLTLTEPATSQEGDFLIALIGGRDTPAWSTPSGWTVVGQENSGNTSTTDGSRIPSGYVAYIERGASAPALTFARTGGDVSYGLVVGYRPSSGKTIAFDTSSKNTETDAGGVISAAALTTANANSLVLAFAVSGGTFLAENTNYSATDPGTSSGSMSPDTSTAPTAGTWLERLESPTVTGANVRIGFADAVKATAGSTGAISFTTNYPEDAHSIFALALYELSTAIVLTAAAGSFALSGQAAGLFGNPQITAAAGAFTLSGQAAGLAATRRLSAAAGAFALTGQDVVFDHGLGGPSDAGAFTLSGQAAGFARDYVVAAEAGAFTLDGQNANLQWIAIYDLMAAAGAFALSGQDVAFRTGVGLAAEAGAFALNGQTAGLARTAMLTGAVGSFALTGQTAGLTRGDTIMDAAAGAFTLSGQAAVLSLSGRLLSPAAGSFALTGVAAAFIAPDPRPQRRLSRSFRREIERQQSAELALVFLTITHPELEEIIRVVSDPKNFVWGGDTYQGFQFEIDLLTDNDRFPEARLSIQNVDQRIGEALRRVTAPARLKIDILAGSQFDLTVSPRTEIGTAVAEYTADALYLVDVEVDVMQITGRITSWNYSQELWPGIRATQDRCPGLFR